MYNDGGYVLKDGNLIASGAKFAVDRFDSLSLGAATFFEHKPLPGTLMVGGQLKAPAFSI